QKNDVTAGSIRVALNGATGMESTMFTIGVQSPELGLPTPLNLQSAQRVNFDAVPSNTDTGEFGNNGWTIGGNLPTGANVVQWQRRQVSLSNFVWSGQDNNGQQDGLRLVPTVDTQTLTSPVMHVGSDPLVPLKITFSHRFSFETAGWDGGVLEITTDGGQTW